MNDDLVGRLNKLADAGDIETLLAVAQGLAAALSQERWVPVSERLPKDDGWVQIWYNQRPAGWRVYQGRYLHALGQWRPEGGNGDFSDLITHWRELPAAPTGSGT